MKDSMKNFGNFLKNNKMDTLIVHLKKYLFY